MNQVKDEQGERVRDRRKYMEQTLQPLILQELLNPSEPKPLPAATPKRPSAQERNAALMKYMESNEFQMELKAGVNVDQGMM